MAADRADWIEALDGMLVFADDLQRRTDEIMQGGTPPIVERVTYQMGLRGRRILQSARELARHEWDDVVGNLSRSLVETAIELDYLHKAVDDRSPEDKASLYECFALIAKERFGERLDPALQEMHAKALAFREKHGVKGHTWHGRKTSGDGSILDRLAILAGEDALQERRTEGLLRAFRQSSFFEHNNALQVFYLERLPSGNCRVLEARPHAAPISAVVLSGSEILWAWGGVLGMSADVRQEALRPVEMVQRKDHGLGPDDLPPWA